MTTKPSSNFTDILTLQATKRAKSIAIYTLDDAIDYETLEVYVWRVATFLSQHNVQAGDVIIHSFEDELLLIVSMLALARMGATLVAVKSNVSTEQLDEIIQTTQATFLPKRL